MNFTYYNKVGLSSYGRKLISMKNFIFVIHITNIMISHGTLFHILKENLQNSKRKKTNYSLPQVTSFKIKSFYALRNLSSTKDIGVCLRKR